MTHQLGGGVARRGGLQRVSAARPMEVRSDRTPQATGTTTDFESWYPHPKLAEVLREEGENAVPTLSLIRRLNCAGQFD